MAPLDLFRKVTYSSRAVELERGGIQGWANFRSDWLKRQWQRRDIEQDRRNVERLESWKVKARLLL